MHEVDVARIALGIEGPLDDERTFVVAFNEPRAAILVGRRVPVC
jgi:hypothetical protein